MEIIKGGVVKINVYDLIDQLKFYEAAEDCVHYHSKEEEGHCARKYKSDEDYMWRNHAKCITCEAEYCNSADILKKAMRSEADIHSHLIAMKNQDMLRHKKSIEELEEQIKKRRVEIEGIELVMAEIPKSKLNFGDKNVKKILRLMK
jgi:hypothetical protein